MVCKLVNKYVERSNRFKEVARTGGEIIQSSGGPGHLSTIPLKNSHLFKITESVISFCLKKISNSAILNKWESFSRMVDHVTYPP